MCLPKNFSFDLYGSFSTPKAEFFGFKADYCRQYVLDQLYPGKNKKCKPISEAKEIISRISVKFAMLNQYFDSSVLDGNSPIKTKIN